MMGSMCSYVRLGCVPDQFGNCTYGIIVEGVFCSDGSVAPTERDCPPSYTLRSTRSAHGSSSSDAYQRVRTGLSLDFVYQIDGHKAIIVQEKTFGVLNVLDDYGFVVDGLETNWHVSGTIQSLSNPDEVYSWAIKRMKEQGAPLAFKMTLPTVQIITDARSGEHLNVRVYELINGFPVAEVTSPATSKTLTIQAVDFR